MSTNPTITYQISGTRHDVFADGIHVGWICRGGASWTAFVATETASGRKVANEVRSPEAAVAAILAAHQYSAQ